MTNNKLTYYDVIDEFGKSRFKQQEDVLTNVNYLNPTKPVVLAFGTDGGKTYTTIMDLIIYFSQPGNKNKQVIIIPASKDDTRDNFKYALDDFKNLDKYFSYCVIDNEVDDDVQLGKKTLKALKNKCNVVVALPQTLRSVVKKLPKVDRIILDEAHEWYFSNKGDGLINKIIKQTSPTHQLLLTGTPYEFNARNDKFDILHYSVEKLQDYGKTGDAEMNVVSTPIDFDILNDFNGEGELRRGTKISKSNIIKSVDNVLLDTLKTQRLPGSIIKSNKLKALQSIGSKLPKSIWYFKRIAHAKYAYEYCKRISIACAISTGDDKESTIKNFKNNDGIKLLIVVNKARQGFSDDELFNIVDFTFSQKPSMLQQMYGRLLRKSKLQPNKIKRYFKVAPKNDIHYYEMLMLGVMNLNLQEFYTTFKGQTSNLPVPVIKKPKTGKGNREGGGEGGEKRLNMSILGEMGETGILLNMESLKELNRKSSDLFSISCYTTLGHIKRELYDIRSQVNKGDLTKELYDETIQKYKITHYNQLHKINPPLASKSTDLLWEPILIKDNKKGRNIDYSLKAVIKWMVDNNIKLFKDFNKRVDGKNIENGQSYRKHYSNYLAEGLIDDIAPKSKSGLSKGHTYNEVDKKKMSEARRKAWANPNKYQDRKKQNFKLTTK
jgi:hypothetical protein